MLRLVRAHSPENPTPSTCPPCDGGFFCGECGWRVVFGLIYPSFCRHCGALFEYQFETVRYEFGLGCAAPGRIFFANCQDPVQWLDRPDAQTEPSQEFRTREAAYLAELLRAMNLEGALDTKLPQDVGPTTACFDCGAIIPIGDAFYSSTQDQRALCEGCYGKAEKAGRAKCRS